MCGCLGQTTWHNNYCLLSAVILWWSFQGANHLHEARRNQFLHTSIGELTATGGLVRQTNSWKPHVILRIHHWNDWRLDEYFPALSETCWQSIKDPHLSGKVFFTKEMLVKAYQVPILLPFWLNLAWIWKNLPALSRITMVLFWLLIAICRGKLSDAAYTWVWPISMWVNSVRFIVIAFLIG